MPFNLNNPTHRDALCLFENWKDLGGRIDQVSSFQDYASDLRYQDGFNDADDPALDRMVGMAEREEEELTRAQKAYQDEALERFGLGELDLMQIRAGGPSISQAEALANVLDQKQDKMTEYEIARQAITLTATRPDSAKGAFVRCGLAYVGGEWLEVRTGISGAVFQAAPFSDGVYSHITPGTYLDLLAEKGDGN